jgi:type IV secretion system protein VirD4
MQDITPIGSSRNDIIGSGEADAIHVGREVLGDGSAGAKVNYGGPLHLVLFGPNGTGKGMRILVPNLLSIVGKSIVVIDPKGQLAAMTAKFRHQIGDDVRIIDPFRVLAEVAHNDPKNQYSYLIQNGLVESSGFNPIAALDPASSSFYDDAAVVAEALIKVQGHEPHWSESAQGLVAGLVMWERVRNGKSANLENVRAMLTEADAWEPYINARGETREKLVRGLRITAERMVKEGDFAISSLGARFSNENTTKEIEAVRSTADTQTRWILSEPMRADLRKDGFDFRKLKYGQRPMTVYVILPSKYLETHSVWLRLVVSEALRASLTAGGRRVLLMLDEFAALGHLSIVERLFGVTRDYGVQMWPVFQDLPQLKSLYAQRWETILGMAGVVQSFRAGDLTTAEWLSKRAGNMTDVAVSYNQGRGSSGGGSNSNSGMSYQQIQRPTVWPEQMFGVQDGYMLAWFAGQQKPFIMFAPMFNAVRSFAERALPNPYYVG